MPLHPEIHASEFAANYLFSLAMLSDGRNEPAIPIETHGPGVCGYCQEEADVLKTEPRSQKSYCRKCAPGRETDKHWPAKQ